MRKAMQGSSSTPSLGRSFVVLDLSLGVTLRCVIGGLLLVGALGSCARSHSQLVMGFATDLSAPDVLDSVQMRVLTSAGVVLIDQSWILPGMRSADFSLPGSFTLFSDDGGEPTVNVELTGLRGGVAVLSRSSTVELASEQTLFLRLTLVERCAGMDCGPGESCIEGICKTATVNTVSLQPYEAGVEKLVDCNSGNPLIDTGTKQAMELRGTGFCEANEWCGESTCYRDQGQGLLWCNPPGDTCTGVDGYESCLVAACSGPLVDLLGPDWHRGHFSGACAAYGTCARDCACDSACVAACVDKMPGCAHMVGAVSVCFITNGASCADPICMPIPT